MTGPDPDERYGRGLARNLAAVGAGPPVLVIADQHTVGQLAPTWLESFDEAGWLYRVRSCGGVTAAAEIAALAAEARSLGAKTIAAIGDSDLLMAAKAAAKTIESPGPVSIVTFSRNEP